MKRILTSLASAVILPAVALAQLFVEPEQNVECYEFIKKKKEDGTSARP